MGANTFVTMAKGKTVGEAFKAARDEALYEHGHAGYTGTIAEKRTFLMIAVPDGEDMCAFVRRLLDEDDPRIADKSGPAGCVQKGPGEFVFFGWASS